MTDAWDEESDPEELGGEFDFRSGTKKELDWGDDGMKLITSYTVRLPHQCDAWVITETTVKSDAIAEMETFIREARAALEKLKEAT